MISGYERNANEARAAIAQLVADLQEMVSEDIRLDRRVHARIIGARGKAIRKLMEEFKVRATIFFFFCCILLNHQNCGVKKHKFGLNFFTPKCTVGSHSIRQSFINHILDFRLIYAFLSQALKIQTRLPSQDSLRTLIMPLTICLTWRRNM